MFKVWNWLAIVKVYSESNVEPPIAQGHSHHQTRCAQQVNSKYYIYVTIIYINELDPMVPLTPARPKPTKKTSKVSKPQTKQPNPPPPSAFATHQLQASNNRCSAALLFTPHRQHTSVIQCGAHLQQSSPTLRLGSHALHPAPQLRTRYHSQVQKERRRRLKLDCRDSI